VFLPGQNRHIPRPESLSSKYKGSSMQGKAKRRVLIKQIVFTITALLIGAVYAGAVFASVGA
jgi:hypothetical protein